MGTNPTGWHHPVAVYAKQVTQGKLHDLCCPMEIAACQRHLDDLRRQGTEDFPYVFDCTRADRIYQFFAQLRQCRGVYQGQPIRLEDWQMFDLGSIYGWVHMDTGYRRFNRVLNVRARGTYKSTENSGKALYHMTADCYYPPYQPEKAVFELSPEVECVAVDKAQARRVMDDARAIGRLSPAVAKRLWIPKANPIVSRSRGGHMRALSSDTGNKDSLSASYYCVDEYEGHETSTLYDLGFNSFGKRPQPLLDCIMTAGDDAENRPGKKEEDYARKILEGKIRDDRYFVNIREVPEGIDPHDKKYWCWANPMLRTQGEYARIMFSQIESEYNAAYGSGDAAKIRKFLTRRLCRWQSLSEDSYLTAAQLELARKAQVSSADFAELVRGRKAWAGFDLGKRIDLTGTALVIPLPDGCWAVSAHGFLPEAAIRKHEHSDRVPYAEWIRDGSVTSTPGAVTENAWAWDWIRKKTEDMELQLQHVCYDGHNATDLAIDINRDTGSEDMCVEVRQTCAGQNLAVKTFRELLIAGKLVLEESPLLLWCLGNAVEFENHYGDAKIQKINKDDARRIDPLAAAMDALAVALLREDEGDLSAAAASADYEM